MQIAKRLHKNGFKVFGWNRSHEPVDVLKAFGAWASSDMAETVGKLSGQRVFWLMLPHELVEEFLQNQLGAYLKSL